MYVSHSDVEAECAKGAAVQRALGERHNQQLAAQQAEAAQQQQEVEQAMVAIRCVQICLSEAWLVAAAPWQPYRLGRQGDLL